MAQDRPSIPAQLKRQLLIESGHRCAIPTCRTPTPLEFEHIIDWTISKKHSFENMIVLCANCHGRKGDKSGQIDRKSLAVYKANLSLINGRYNDFEKRVIEYFATAVKNNIESLNMIAMQLPTGTDFFIKYLVDDVYCICTVAVE
jgi:HNH endonuclease